MSKNVYELADPGFSFPNESLDQSSTSPDLYLSGVRTAAGHILNAMMHIDDGGAPRLRRYTVYETETGMLLARGGRQWDHTDDTDTTTTELGATIGRRANGNLYDTVSIKKSSDKKLEVNLSKLASLAIKDFSYEDISIEFGPDKIELTAYTIDWTKPQPYNQEKYTLQSTDQESDDFAAIKYGFPGLLPAIAESLEQAVKEAHKSAQHGETLIGRALAVNEDLTSYASDPLHKDTLVRKTIRLCGTTIRSAYFAAEDIIEDHILPYIQMAYMKFSGR